MAATRSSLSRSQSGASLKPSRSLSLEYPLDLIPAGGSEVVRGSAAPIKHENKDAAGHFFHEFALRQAGVVGEQKKLWFFFFSSDAPSLFSTPPVGSDFFPRLAGMQMRACQRHPW